MLVGGGLGGYSVHEDVNADVISSEQCTLREMTGDVFGPPWQIWVG